MLRHLAVLALVLLTAVPVAPAQAKVPASKAEVTLSFVPVVKRAQPSVVNIYTRKVVAERVNPFMSDPFFSELFRDFGTLRPRVESSLGSGVIADPSGLVITNYHVVGGADDIRVVLSDRREFSAAVVLADEDADLAVLKLDGARDLPALAFRDSDEVEVGELVLAIGNPFGVGQTVTSGIVSGLARSGIGPGGGRGYYIQTDAPINPGNSGGALIDIDGRLIGINTLILSRSGGSNGIGFAIPANLAARFLDQARAGKDRFERPWAGLTGQPVDASLAEALGLPLPEGVVITEMHPSSPFAKAGLRPGDVVLAIDGRPVNSPAEMLFRLTVRGIGATVEVDYWRDGKRHQASVALAPPPDEPPRAEMTFDTFPFEGLHVVTLNPAVASEYGLGVDAKGVLVIEPGPVLLRVGLRPGDIILAVQGQEVATTAELRRVLGRDARRWEFVVSRAGRIITLRFSL
ncbi:MAG: Do family serine endopeptidase [Alphaproteobacteria bacterium]|nr:MAG: Do family serine endopeptidase [Alphaproteobacteria bacterium]